MLKAGAEQLLELLRSYVVVDDEGYPHCACGARMWDGTMLWCHGGWHAYCPVCLAQLPADERTGFTFSEFVCLVLMDNGYRVFKEQCGENWNIRWIPRTGVTQHD